MLRQAQFIFVGRQDRITPLHHGHGVAPGAHGLVGTAAQPRPEPRQQKQRSQQQPTQRIDHGGRKPFFQSLLQLLAHLGRAGAVLVGLLAQRGHVGFQRL